MERFPVASTSDPRARPSQKWEKSRLAAIARPQGGTDEKAEAIETIKSHQLFLYDLSHIGDHYLKLW
jgi:hypothetical protein